MTSALPVKRFFGLTAVVALLTAAALGQSVRGFIWGKVTDQKGKRIPGATVTIANPSIEVRKKDTTKDNGHFTITGLQPSTYIVKVEKEGYQPFEKTVILEPMGRKDASPINLLEISKAGNTPNQAGMTGSDELHIILIPLDNHARNESGPRIDPVDDPGNQTQARAGSAGAQGAQPAPTQSQPIKTASDQIDAGRLQLQSLSGERSDLITNNQVKNLALNGRDIIEFLKLMPGVVSDFNGQISNPDGLDKFFINGTRGNQHDLAIDGVSNVNTATNGSRHVTINPDAVAEIRVLTANYQAEYGKAAGGFIQIVTKSGTTEFHGGARFFHRHESLNANNFLNNAAGRKEDDSELLPRPKYRYKSFGFDIGGPVYLPRFSEGGPVFKKINNLFFFVNQEFYRQLAPNPRRFIRVPTVKERMGDFSDTQNVEGGALSLKGFPNNMIPENDWYRFGEAILQIYPLPNIPPSDANNFANYVSQASTRYPRSETVARIDYKLGEQTELSVRGIHNSGEQALPFGIPGNLNLDNTARILRSTNPNAQNFDKWNVIFQRPGINAAFSLAHSFDQTFTNEFIFGLSRSRGTFAPEAGKATIGANNLSGFPALFPNPNPGPGDFIPNFNFGTLVEGPINTFGPATTFDGLPFRSQDQTLNFTDNLTKVWNAHLVKIGVFLQQSRRDQTTSGSNNADIGFGAEDTRHPFANALLGIYSQYDQSEKFLTGFYRYRNVEGYIQDLWRVNDRLVFDLGLRVSWYQPQYDARLQASFFDPAFYDPSKAVRLYTPVCINKASTCESANNPNRRAVDPALLVPDFTPTEANTLLASFLSRIVPNSGDISNGFGLASKGHPRGGIQDRGVQWGPRFGFAYDLFGNGRTILRGGFGIFYDRIQGGMISDMLLNPPSSGLIRTLRFGRLDGLDPSKAFFTPPTVYGIAKDGKIPTVYSFSLNLQRDIGLGTVVDVAYVGTLGRHLVQARDLNAVRYGAAFMRENQDLTKFSALFPCANPCEEEPNLASNYPFHKAAGLKFSGEFAKDSDRSTTFLRPFRGYGEIRYYEFGGSSNYHSLQISTRRRLSRSLALSVAYTWSKAFSTAGEDLELTNPFNPNRYDYRLAAFDHTHVFAASYVYTLPGLSRRIADRWLARAILAGWQLSGITQFSSGPPFEILNLSGGHSKFITGSSTEPTRLYLRPDVNPRLKNASSSLQINRDAFLIPRPGQIDPAPAPRAYLRNPGINNWDISIFKNISLGAEGRYLQLRLEMFNAFNHTQFNNINNRSYDSGVQGSDPYIEFPTRSGMYCHFLSGKPIIISQAKHCSNPNGPPFDRSRRPLGTLFGEYSSARDPRIIQLAAKLYF